LISFFKSFEILFFIKRVELIFIFLKIFFWFLNVQNLLIRLKFLTKTGKIEIKKLILRLEIKSKIEIMNFQVIQDNNGNNSGIFITSQDWTLIKQQYPDIEEISNDIPQWQKDILNDRLATIAKNPERVKPIQGLFDALDKKVKNDSI
jgi:hypothetical protein